MSRFAIGALCALAGAVLWGFSGAGIQLLTDEYGAPPLFVTTMRMLGAGALFGCILLARRRGVLAQMLRDRATRRQLAVFGFFGLFCCQLTYVITIALTNAGTATALQGLNVAFVVIIACLAGRRAPTPFEVIGAATAFTAVVLIATKGDLGSLGMPLAGLVWGVASAGTVVVYTMYPRRMFARWGSMPVTGLGMAVGGVASLGVFAAAGVLFDLSDGAAGMAAVVPQLDGFGVLVAASVVVFGTFGAFGLFLHGVSIVGSVKGSQLGAVEPLSATLFSALWLGTPFTWADWLGLALMIATVFIVSAQAKER